MHSPISDVVCLLSGFPVEIVKVQRLMEKVGWPNPAKLPASDGHDRQTILKLLRTTARSFYLRQYWMGFITAQLGVYHYTHVLAT